MKQVTALLLLCLLAVLAHTQMTFNLTSASYQVVSGFYSLNIPVSGGVPPYSYTFQAYPDTWLQSGKNINIPLVETNPGGTWAIKAIVTDALGNKLQRSLVIKISNGGNPLIGDYPYDQTFSFSSTGAVTSLPTNAAIVSLQTASSSSSSNLSLNPSSISSSSSSSLGAVSSAGSGMGMATSTAGVIPLQTAGTGSNVKLPSSSQLDSLINSGDIMGIKQTVQSVIMSTLSCVSKTQYLSDLLGRISSYIAIKNSQLGQLQNIISTTQTQIQILKGQIANYTAQINNLGLSTLQNRLIGILDSLQVAYNAYNNGNIDLTPYNLNITVNMQSINNLTTQKAEAANQLNLDKKSLNDTSTLIASLQKQLADAQKNQVLLSFRILQHNNNLTNITNKIDMLNADNVRLNNQINLINTNKTVLQATYQALETQAENVKSTISAYQTQQSQYQTQINTLNNQIQQINGNLDPTQAINLNSTINSLLASIPSLQQQIDYVKFNCLGVVNYTVNTLNGTISYVFGSSTFSTYITGQFGTANTNTAQNLLGPVSNITLTPATIFSKDWVNLFGQPFANDLSKVSATATQTSNFFASDFNCSSNSVLTSGNAVVTNIIANVINASLNDKTTVTLILGACSNILVLNDVTPKVGTSIFWNGLKVNPITYQVYSALFI